MFYVGAALQFFDDKVTKYEKKKYKFVSFR